MLNYQDLIAWIEERAILRGDCWVWRLSVKDGSMPQGKYLGQTINVRRAVIEARTGVSIPKAWVAQCTCGTDGCVRPEHLIQKSRSKAFKGRKFTEAHKAALAKAAQARSRFTDEDIEDIRNGPGSDIEKSIKYGVSKRYMWDMRTGRVWKDYSNPFNQLLNRPQG